MQKAQAQVVRDHGQHSNVIPRSWLGEGLWDIV